MVKITHLRQLQPEIPIFINLQLRIEAAPLLQHGPSKERGVNRNIVVLHQQYRIIILIEGEVRRFALFCNFCCRTVGYDHLAVVCKGGHQIADMFGSDPVIIIQKQQIFSGAGLEAKIGSFRARQMGAGPHVLYRVGKFRRNFVP